MGRAIRKYNAFYMRLQRQVKAKCQKLATLMAPGFTDDAFVDEFSNLCSVEWKELQEYWEYSRQRDRTRPGRKFNFPSPKYFVLRSSQAIRNAVRRQHLAGSAIDQILADEVRRDLEQRNARRIARCAETEKLRGERIQHVPANYLHGMMHRYRQDTPQERLLTVKELGKYDTPYSRRSLYRVIAGEEDYFIRQEAFFLLQQMGCVVFLPKKGHGRKNKKNRLLKYHGHYRPDIGRGPSDIMGDITRSAIEAMKRYHVFLSHSSRDREMVLGLVSRLNTLDYVVYVDWVSDREDMDRKKTNTDTAMVLLERMKQSNALMVIQTSDASVSPWVAWEIGFYLSTGKKICVYDTGSPPAYDPEFMRMHPRVRDVGGQLLVEVNGQHLLLRDWLI
jgi:hypothetical protein